jgi:hypothetical protein
MLSVGTFRRIKACDIICLLGHLEHVAEGTKQLHNMLFLNRRHGFASQKIATDIIDNIHDFITFLNLSYFLQKKPYRGNCRSTALNQHDSCNPIKLFRVVSIILCFLHGLQNNVNFCRYLALCSNYHKRLKAYACHI